MLPVGIIGAMDSEVALLVEKLQEAQTVKVGAVTYHTGTLGGTAVVSARCGIGKVCAAMCAQAMIDRFAVRYILNTGVAGGIAAGLSVGDMVLSTYAVQHDFDVTAFGHVRGYMCDGGDHTRPTRYEADSCLRTLFMEVAAKALPGHKAIEGAIATGDVFVADNELKKQLAETFSAAAAEMEGGAVAQVAVANRVPFLIIRAISDLAEGGAPVSFDTFEKEAAANSARMLLCVLPKL